MVHAVLADGAQKGLREAAMPTAADHQKVGAGRGVDQHLSWVPFPYNSCSYRAAAGAVSHGRDRVGQCFGRELPEIGGLQHANRRPGVATDHQWEMPGDNGFYGRSGKRRLPDSPAKGLPGGWRTVNPDDNARRSGALLL
jgi:hypothetical protein